MKHPFVVSAALAWTALAGASGIPLPHVAQRFNEIEVLAPTAFRVEAYNAFTAWVSMLPLNGSSANFYIGSNAPVASITVQSVSGSNPSVACVTNRSFDYCATSISGVGTAAISIKLYSTYTRGGQTSVIDWSNHYLKQNILMRAMGIAMGAAWNTAANVSGLMNGTPGIEEQMAHAYIFPDVVDANDIRAAYGAASNYDGSSNLVPIAEFVTKNSSGKAILYSRELGIVGKSIPGKTLRHIRWIVSTASYSPTGDVYKKGCVNQEYSDGRIMQVGYTSSFPSSGTLRFQFVGLGENLLGAELAANIGAPINMMMLESHTTAGDYINPMHPAPYYSPRVAGKAIDVWNGN